MGWAVAADRRQLLAALCTGIGVSLMVSIILLLLGLPWYPWTLPQEVCMAVLSGLGFALIGLGGAIGAMTGHRHAPGASATGRTPSCP